MLCINKCNVFRFDEVHFGGFASKYIQNDFFFDVHPPLAKMIIAFTGWISGFKGDFAFSQIGLDYLLPGTLKGIIKGVPYIAMRSCTAVFGALIVPMTYKSLRSWGFSITSSAIVSLFLAFENGFMTQSRFILLDSLLIFFIAFAFTCWSLVESKESQYANFNIQEKCL